MNTGPPKAFVWPLPPLVAKIGPVGTPCPVTIRAQLCESLTSVPIRSHVTAIVAPLIDGGTTVVYPFWAALVVHSVCLSRIFSIM